MIRAAPERLFAAWTESERIKTWWGPADVTCPDAEIDLRVGGRFRIANKLPNGNIVWISGEFSRIEPPRILVYSWRLEPGEGGNERVTVRFDPHGDMTEVVVLHEQIPDTATRDQHEMGWNGCLDGLADYLKD
jgi:uncharacterized protein YndB with AHSA1/START domain